MKKTEKIRFEIDPHNRLVYEKTGRKSDVPGFRTVVDGKFEIDKDNQLIYHVKKAQGSDIPQQLKLKGKWALDDEHNLMLTLDKWGDQIAGNKLTIKSELIDAKDNMLAFSMTTKDSENSTHIYIVKLGGRWQADKYNRFTFNVQKETGITDKITLTGAWEVNKQNEIIYTYEKSTARKKERISKTITLRGYWDITEKYRILYVLNKKINSTFDFEVGFIRPTKSGMEYQIKIGVVPAAKILTLSGKWKVSKKLGLLLEIPYEGREVQGIVFGASCKLSEKDMLELKLKNISGEDLGASLRLSRKILKDQGEAFVEAVREGKEVSLLAGIGFRW